MRLFFPKIGRTGARIARDSTAGFWEREVRSSWAGCSRLESCRRERFSLAQI